MGCRILYDNNNDMANMYDSVTDTAFGPVFCADSELNVSADERIEAFMRWLKVDPRVFDDINLSRKYNEWRGQEAEQYRTELKSE